ncbi:two pore domain potassium channel family protein, partial [Methyloceanibacter sp.]|uniref:two pore domain potassium channel family protein n=1 Tax=Methyloceanibacter sp. TaxID=1965321 RepID=UPI002D235820
SGVVLGQVLAGGAASLINLVIHAVLLAAVVWTVRRLSVSDRFVPHLAQYTLIIVATGTLLVAGHCVEVVLWAVTYGFVGAAAPGARLVELAFANYTTLGYNGTPLAENWWLLAPMTALNGIMLIGWSTALIIEILRHGGETAPSS